MHRCHIAIATLLVAAVAPLSAQCQRFLGPLPSRVLGTGYQGTTFLATTTPPDFGVSLDPGTAVLFDLTVAAPIDIRSIGTNVLNDGGTYSAITVPNLIGAANGTMEVWIVPGGTVTNPTLFGGSPYTHLPAPGTPPIAPWVQLSNPATHLGNLVFAAPDAPSVGTFNPPLFLGVGTYAVALVLVPSGVAGPGGVPANPATQRIHPLATNLATIPGPTTFTDSFLTITNPAVQVQAFGAGRLSATTTPAVIPNFDVTYVPAAGAAHSVPYGTGCYRSFASFYESWQATGSVNNVDIDPAGSAGAIWGLDFAPSGQGYLVTTNAAPGLFVAPGSTAGRIHLNTRAPALAGLTGWDDATTGPLALPFTFPLPGTPLGSNLIDVSSNGICYFSTATRTFGFYDDYNGFLAGPPAIAAAWCDFEPTDLFTFFGGSGDLWFDVDAAGQWVAVTWENVRIWNEPTNISTVQLVLFANGVARIRYGGFGVNFANAPVLVGFTPGNGSPDPGSGLTPRRFPDLSLAAATGFQSAGAGTASILRLVGRPVVGSPLLLDTLGSPPTIGANLTILSGAALPGGFSLAVLGMPGCQGWIGNAILSDLRFGPPPYRWTASTSIPPSVAGIDLFAQAAQIGTVLPGFNPANTLVSDALCIHFDLQ